MKRNVKKSMRITNIAIVLVLLVIIGTFLYLRVSNTQTTLKKNINVQPVAVDTITTAPEPTNTNTKTIVGGDCYNEALGLTITLPSNWECTTESINVETDYPNGILKITSPFYSILIGNYGRGPGYCGHGKKPANTDESCTTEEFYENTNVKLVVYKSFGESKEIYGMITRVSDKSSGITSVSIKYKNMENENLTSEQRQELITIMDSIVLD